MSERINREKLVYRYTSALERGDFETVEAILLEAENDAELEEMIMEVMEAYQQAMEGADQLAPAPRGSKVRRGFFERMMDRLPTYAVAGILIAVGVIAVLTLLGPQTGSVFSEIVSQVDPEGMPVRPGVGANAAQPTPLATQAAAATNEPFAMPSMTAPASGVIQVTPLGQDSAQPTGDSQLPPADMPTQERLIIKNGEMRLLVEDTDRAIDQVTHIAVDNGGYVIGSQAWSVDWGKAATITIAVEAEHFETAMRRLRDISIEVLQESATGEDVSTEFVDLQSRLRNLEATRDRMREFLDQAQNVDEALDVNAELARVEEEIEVVMGRMQYLQGRAAFSTIRIDLEMPMPTPTPTMTPTQTLTPTPTFTPTPWSIQPVIDNAAEAQTRTARGLLGFLTWLVIVPGPYLLLGGLIWLGVRAWMKRCQEEEAD